jgi:hypothetical protein
VRSEATSRMKEGLDASAERSDAEPQESRPPDSEERSDELAGWTGLEPATSDVTGRRSNQLNYHPAVVFTAAGAAVVTMPFGDPFCGGAWWAVQDSNLRPPVCKTDALPLS